MQITQLSQVLQFPTGGKLTIILYATRPKVAVPSDLPYRAFDNISCLDDIKMVFAINPPSLYILPPTTEMEWRTLPLCQRGYRVYCHPTTPRVAVECLRHDVRACGGIVRTFNSLWQAVEVLGR